MKRTHLQIALVTFMGIGLVACGREEAVPAAKAQATDGMQQSDSKKGHSPDTGPKVVDPLKEGY